MMMSIEERRLKLEEMNLPDRDEPLLRGLRVFVVDPYGLAHARTSNSLHRGPSEVIFALPEEVHLVYGPVWGGRKE